MNVKRFWTVTHKFLSDLLGGASFDFSKCKTNADWRALYDLYLESPAWRKKREARLLIDKHRCTVCGSGKRLEVHHTTYANVGHENLYDLRTLCHACHAEIKQKRGQH